MRLGPNIAVRVEFMARHVPSQAGNVTHGLFVTLLYRCHLSIAIEDVMRSSDFCAKSREITGSVIGGATLSILECCLFTVENVIGAGSFFSTLFSSAMDCRYAIQYCMRIAVQYDDGMVRTVHAAFMYSWDSVR